MLWYLEGRIEEVHKCMGNWSIGELDWGIFVFFFFADLGRFLLRIGELQIGVGETGTGIGIGALGHWSVGAGGGRCVGDALDALGRGGDVVGCALQGECGEVRRLWWFCWDGWGGEGRERDLVG